MKEKIRSMKKRKPGDLEIVCEEMITENSKRWKKRRLDEEILRKEKEREEKLQIEKEREKIERLDKAKRKKEELIKKLREKGELVMLGKNTEWIKRKKESWRKYREKESLNSDDEEELRRKVIELIPERKLKLDQLNPENPKSTEAPIKNSSTLFDEDPLYTVKLELKAVSENRVKISSQELNVTDPNLSYVQETEVSPTQPPGENIKLSIGVEKTSHSDKIAVVDTPEEVSSV